EASGVTPHMHNSDRQLLDLQRQRIGNLDTEAVEHGAVMAVGPLDVSVVHTPGHTPGSICLRVGGHLFSGDTLFPGGPGSTQGPLADFPSIIRSVGEELFELPDDVQVHPGHGHSTSIGDERPHLDEWIQRGW
ncbi:MAG: MBL fold metallo-hydrolase, partial [Acidimicrobiia bacterium]